MTGAQLLRMLIGTRMRYIEWCYFQWPWLTHNYPKPPRLDILYRLSHFRNGEARLQIWYTQVDRCNTDDKPETTPVRSVVRLRDLFKFLGAPLIYLNTIWYDTVDLRALKSWRDGQLSLAHGPETKNNEKIQIKNRVAQTTEAKVNFDVQVYGIPNVSSRMTNDPLMTVVSVTWPI